MPRRALTNWMHHRLELTQLLVTRHPLLARLDPGRRVLRALGFASELVEHERRPRRFVPSLASNAPLPLTAEDVERGAGPALLDDAAPLDIAEVAEPGTAAVGSEPMPEPVHSDDRKTEEALEVEAAAPARVGSTDVAGAPRAEHVRRADGVPRATPRIEVAATAPSPPETFKEFKKSGSLKGSLKPSLKPAVVFNEPGSLNTPVGSPADRAVESPAGTSTASGESGPAPAPSSAATPIIEQRRARRPARLVLTHDPTLDRDARDATQPLDHAQTSDVAAPRESAPVAEQPAPAHRERQSSPGAIDAGTSAAEPSPAERSTLDWMRLLVEATTEPAMFVRSRPGRPATRSATPAARADTVPPSAMPVPGHAPPTRSAAPPSSSPRPGSPAPVRPHSTTSNVRPVAPATAATTAKGAEAGAPGASIAAHPAVNAQVPAQSATDPERSVEPYEPIPLGAALHSLDDSSTAADDARGGSDESSSILDEAAPDSPTERPLSTPTSRADEAEAMPRPAAGHAAAIASTLASLPAPAPLAPSTRRFLKPLVGIDSETVRIHRGPGVSEIAERRNAEALTVGDQVVLAGYHDERNPDTLGILGHELAHVARVREPRFVPPVTHSSSIAEDEESLALGVERAVRNAAQHEGRGNRSIQRPDAMPASIGALTNRQRLAPHTMREGIAPRPTRTAQGSFARSNAPEFPGEAPRIVAAPVDVPVDAALDAQADAMDESPWGGLPAPWEPLPDVVTRMLNSSSEAAEASVAATPGTLASAGSAAESAVVASPAVQAAARDRNVSEATGGEAALPPPRGNGSSPAPDIDALSRQVYDVLKRRLAAERRRGA